MKTTAVNTQYHGYTSSNKIGGESKGDSLDTFEKELMNWEERVKEKINKDSENDGKNVVEMSDKQWHDIINKVDNAISNIKKSVKEQKENKQLPEKKTDCH
jgi:hypothetical protein